MPRLVKKTGKGPMMVGDKKICMCGLTQNEPFCDKSHLKVQDEDDSKLYWYESDKREEIETIEEDCSECDGNCHHHHEEA